MDFTSYIEKKKQLSDHMNDIDALLIQVDLKNSHVKYLEQMKNMQNEKFCMVVIGEFSRGKSTFINALLGKAILPSSKSATTNIISKIEYGDKPKYTLSYKDGKKDEISEEEFLAIKAQAEDNPDKFQQLKRIFHISSSEKFDFSKIEYATINYPIVFCKNNVEVVDTPGTNDLNVSRMDITYNYLKKAEAAILLLSATQPLTKSEKEFLNDQVIGNQIRDIFIVVNYKDQVLGEEEKIKKHILDNLQDVGDFSQRYFMVSSKQALIWRRKQNGEQFKSPRALMDLPNTEEETGIPALEEALGYFLNNEKGTAKLKKYTEYSYIALDEIEKQIVFQKKMLLKSTEEITRTLTVERPKYIKTKSEIGYITQGLKNALLMQENELNYKAKLVVSKIKEAAVQAVDGLEDGMDEKDLEYLITKAVQPLQKEFINEANAYQDDIIHTETKKAINNLHQFWKDIDFDFQSMPILSDVSNSIALSNYDLNNENNNEDSFLTAAGAYLIAGFFAGASAGLLAAAAAWYFTGGSNLFVDRKAQLKNEIRKQYRNKYNGFEDKICAQYRETVDNICMNLETEVNTYIDELDDQFHKLVEQKQMKDTDVSERIKELDEKLKLVNDYRQKLQEVINR